MQVARGAGSAQVAGGGEDRVDRVVRVGVAGVDRVDAVLDPSGRHELHPADRAGRRDRQVGSVVGLDLVDRGEDLPRHSVLHRGGLVDRQQEQRDAIEGQRLRGSRRAGELSRERFLLSGDHLRRDGDVAVGRCGAGGPRGRRRARRTARLRFRQLSGAAAAPRRGLSPTVSRAPSLRLPASLRPTWVPASACSRWSAPVPAY